MENFVIIGNSGAAINAIRAIRSINKRDKITLISKENCIAYSPVAITYYINGTIPYECMFLCRDEFYELNKVDTILGFRCIGINTKTKMVILENHNSVRYDKLLISTGSSPLIPGIAGANSDNIFTARTIKDAKMIKHAIDDSKDITIVGAGLVGSQIANAILNKNKNIILIEKQSNIMTGILDEEAANMVQKNMVSNGIHLFLNNGVVEIHRKDGYPPKNKVILSLDSGKQLKTDIAVLASGFIPNTEFLRDSNIKMSKGILVNENMQTNINGIYAAGDVAENINTITWKNNINPTWLNAMRQGWAAGLNIAGKKISLINSIRANISNMFGFHIVSIGAIIKENTNFQEIACCRNKYYRKLVFDGDFLVGLLIISETEDELKETGVIINLIERRKITYHNLYRDFYNQSSLSRFLIKEFYDLNRN